MKRLLLVIVLLAAALSIGFIAGIYTLPILTAPNARPAAEIQSLAQSALYRGEFRRDLEDSDALHWGEGTVSVGPRTISLAGKIAPGPDYKLYLTPEFVETEADFMRVRAASARVGDVKNFENFVVAVPQTVDVSQFTTVVVWCESFSQFITAAAYRELSAGAAVATTAPATFLVVYKPGPAFRVGKPMKEQDLKEHGPYLLDLYAQGALTSAGRFLDDSGGAVVLSAADLAAATAFVENDPAVRLGVFVYELHPWERVDWQQHLERRLERARKKE